VTKLLNLNIFFILIINVVAFITVTDKSLYYVCSVLSVNFCVLWAMLPELKLMMMMIVARWLTAW